MLSELNVREGEAVPSGKIIGTIDSSLMEIESDRARTKLDIAREKAMDKSAIDVAIKKYKLAKHEYEVADRLASKGSKSNQERMRAKYSMDAAFAEVTVAKMQQREALGITRVEEINLKEITQIIRKLKIDTQFDGHVLEIYKHAGEWANKGDKIVRFARMDKLWIEGTVPADECNPADVLGQPVTVRLNQAGDQKVQFEGKVVSVPLRMEGIGNRFRVRGEVKNRFENGVWLLRPGASLSMQVQLNANTANRETTNVQR